MNEKVKQLALKSQLMSINDLNGDLVSSFHEDIDLTEELEEFVALIVNECINYCGENLSKTVSAALKINLGVAK